MLSAKLETKKDGYDTDTDVRESHEIQKKVQKERRTARQLRHQTRERTVSKVWHGENG